MENLEFEVLDSFERVLKASLIKELPAFERVFRELQGSADFVGFPHEKLIGTYDFSKLSSLEHGSLVLSILKYNSGRTKDYIKERTGITDTALNRTLRELKANDFLVKKKNLYFLSKSFVQESDNIWAFDLKAPNWKRALQQATLYKAFANYVVAVRPFDEEEALQEKLELFAREFVRLASRYISGCFDDGYCPEGPSYYMKANLMIFQTLLYMSIGKLVMERLRWHDLVNLVCSCLRISV